MLIIRRLSRNQIHHLLPDDSEPTRGRDSKNGRGAPDDQEGSDRDRALPFYAVTFRVPTQLGSRRASRKVQLYYDSHHLSRGIPFDRYIVGAFTNWDSFSLMSLRK
jgi:hypothetical protein